MKIDLVIIDPQMDFMDYPGQAGSLAVPGAHEDMLRLSKMIAEYGSELNDIHITMDSHHPMDIAHPRWWVDAQGNAPTPFTIINSSDVASGKWKARIKEYQVRSAEYVKQLEDNGRYLLCIWPEHCLIGSVGYSVHPELFKSLANWERENLAVVEIVTKGSNPLTEHYSGLKAEVPDPDDLGTQLNVPFIHTMDNADMILLAGEALSHCLAYTARDIADAFDQNTLSKIVILEDATSPVPGFEKEGQDFLAEMRARGVRVMKTTDFVKPGRARTA